MKEQLLMITILTVFSIILFKYRSKYFKNSLFYSTQSIPRIQILENNWHCTTFTSQNRYFCLIKLLQFLSPSKTYDIFQRK